MFKIADLTKGNEGKRIFMFALPMLIGNVFQQLYNTADSIIVGRTLGKSPLAAVSSAGPIMFLLISLLAGITVGSTVVISQYYGAKDIEKVKRAISTTYIFIFIGSIIMTIIGIIFCDTILDLIRVPDEIKIYSSEYLKIIFIGIIGMAFYNSLAAILRGLGDSLTPLYFLIGATILNIVLDLIFIINFHMGVSGAAWATIISQLSAAIGCFLFVNKKNVLLRINIKNMVFDLSLFAESVKIGLPTAIQQMLVSLGMTLTQSMVNGYGIDAVAGYGAAGRIESFASMPAMNFSNALSAFVGQNIGAGEQKRAQRGLKYTIVISGGITIIISLILVLFGSHLINVFNSDSNVVAIGKEYFTYVCSFFFLLSTQFALYGFLRGSGDSFITMILSLLSQWVIRIPFAYIFSNMLGIRSIWVGIVVGWVIGLSAGFIYYLSGRWKSKALIKNKIITDEA